MKIYYREKYISKIRPFYHSDIIKVITGIRRCGKSFILKSIIKDLLKEGVKDSDIIYLPLDLRNYKSINTPNKLEKAIEKEIKNKRKKYIFIDEIQNVKEFEKIILAYQEEGYSIYITGSNSYLLSDEITTKLTGRYLTFEVFPLDFKEYIEMNKLFKKNISNNINKEFEKYIKNGGFPKAIEFNEFQAKQKYVEGIIDEIFKKDIYRRTKINNKFIFEKLKTYIINNYTSQFSVNNIIKEFKKMNINTKPTTIHRYINELCKSKILYECYRFDIKSKKSISSCPKYYLSDLSIYFSTNTDNQLNIGPSLENIIYTYLLSNDYKVSIGKIGNLECDFIVRKPDNDYAYIQVTYTMQSVDKESTRKLQEREYKPFSYIRNGYPRYIISLDTFKDQKDGIHHINAIDLLLGKETI